MTSGSLGSNDSFSDIMPGKIKWKYEESLCKEAYEIEPELNEDQAEFLLADLKAYLFLRTPTNPVEFEHTDLDGTKANTSNFSTESRDSFVTVIENSLKRLHTEPKDSHSGDDSSGIKKSESPSTSNFFAEEDTSFVPSKKTQILENEFDNQNFQTLVKQIKSENFKNDNNIDLPKSIQLKIEEQKAENKDFDLEALNSCFDFKKQKIDIYIRSMVMDLILFSILNNSETVNSYSEA